MNDVKMLRRNPTRIELTLDNLEELNSDSAEKPNSEVTPFKGTALTSPTKKDRRILVGQRIGYNPRPVPGDTSGTGANAATTQSRTARS